MVTYVVVLEVQFTEFLQNITGSSTKISMWTSEFRKDVADEEVFHVIGNRTLFPKNDGSECSYHA